MRVVASGDTWTVDYGDGTSEDFSEAGEALEEAQRVARASGRAVVIEHHRS